MLYRPTNIPRYFNASSFHLSSIMSNIYVKRSTFFKVPKAEDIETVLKQYEILRKTAVKVKSDSNQSTMSLF